MRRNRGQSRWNSRFSNYNSRSGHPSLSRRPSTFDVEFLKQLYKKSDEDVLTEFSKKNTDFMKWIQGGNDVGEKMYFLMAILSRIISSPFVIHKGAIFTKICRGDFFKELFSFIMLLPAYSETEKRSNQTLWSNMDTFWTNVIILCSSLFDVVPTNAIEVVSKLISTAQLTISNFERESFKIADEVKEQLSLLEKKLQMCIDDIEEKRKRPVAIEPPNDFRQISLYPTSEEILQGLQPFLRENKVDGNYKDVNEYLDIQFRLLREDFVKPLREGINEYIMQQNGVAVKKRIVNVKVYKNVTLLEVVYVNGEIGRKVQLFDTRNKFSRGYNSKRLIYGSLVCFTKDYFKTLIFGRITCTDEKLLKQGQIIVHLEANADESSKEKYVMVECGIYFEPYYVVLTALQQLEIARFPLKQFIVDTCTKVNCPNYLKEIQQDIPGERYSELNNKQYEAFTAALSKELVIIQGPPGTGKTHLGLKIVRTILQFREILSDTVSVSGPILVLCYTNHALDQFLEGILRFTRRIVRVGGQSKSERLKAYNLKEVYRQYTRNPLLENMKESLKRTALEIKRINCLFDVINHCDGVIHFMEFENIVPEFTNSWFFKRDPEEIVQWLCGRINKRNYIEQHETKNDSLREEEQNTSERSESIETSSYDNKINDANMMIEVHSGFDQIDFKELSLCLTYDITEAKQFLNQLASDLEKNKNVFIQSDGKNKIALGNIHRLEWNMEYEEEIKNYIQLRLLEGKQWKINNKPDSTDLVKPHNMSAINRWRLYFYWLNLYKKWAEEQVNELVKEYLVKLKEYEEQKAIEDVKLMRNKDVIGMTTTGAARIQSTLQALKCPIVVVEEAAEILESHVVASLTEHCQHLILIGDHQQLRPTTADYTMEKKMKLGVSLFERFIINKFEYSRLNIQHRMRPQISNLICPAIYPDLVDHPSVLDYTEVKGMDNSVYFIDHSEQEVKFGDSSKQNPHEAKFLVRLAQHLLCNGNAPTDITILVAYLGQYYAVMDEMRNFVLPSEVRCAVLDNYQGEESEIILLSLVRNNKENSIGFLKIENRVCVALSRAKHGLYIMGNMELLCQNSDVWPKIKDVLVSQNSLGEHLVLRCQNHIQHTLKVKSHSDFEKVPNGCCGQVCGFQLKCGHQCVSSCHLDDPMHKFYKCEQPCSRVLCDNESHVCNKRCFKECGLCFYEVEQTLSCGHLNKVSCYKTRITELNELTCQFPCDRRIEKCGHICTLTCHVDDDPEHKYYRCMQHCSKDARNCSLENDKHRCKNNCYEECKPCSEVVEKPKTSCKHVFKVPCSENVDICVPFCDYPCDKLLQCGHNCTNECGEHCNTSCKVMVEKILPSCGHKIMCPCSDENFQQNYKCEEIVDMTDFAVCGHKFKVPCHIKHLQPDDPVLLARCPEECTSVLVCGHTCTGTCVTCFQGRVHKACTVSCENILVCGHKCELSCGKPCEPCSQRCNFSCVHGKCEFFCGQRCFRCNKKCPRACKHGRCSNKCGNQVCTISPCEEACTKVFDCGHRCIGFCGDVCPTFCYICSGKAIKNNVNYIVLQECGHIFEVEEMKRYLLEGQNTIGLKLCPLCKVRLNQTHRIKEYMWEGINQLQQIMKKMYNVDLTETPSLSTNRYMIKVIRAAGLDFLCKVTTATENMYFHFKRKIIEAMSEYFAGRILPLHGGQQNYIYCMCDTEMLIFLTIVQTSFFENLTLSLQQVADILKEFNRCLNKLDLIVLLAPVLQSARTLDSKKMTVTDFNFLKLFEKEKNRLNNEQKEKAYKLINLLYSVRNFTDDDDVLAKDLLNSLDTNNTLEQFRRREDLGFPEKFSDDIISYDRDSWFKCSEGHLNPCYRENKRSCKICEHKQDENEENENDGAAKRFRRANRRKLKQRYQRW